MIGSNPFWQVIEMAKKDDKIIQSRVTFEIPDPRFLCTAQHFKHMNTPILADLRISHFLIFESEIKVVLPKSLKYVNIGS